MRRYTLAGVCTSTVGRVRISPVGTRVRRVARCPDRRPIGRKEERGATSKNLKNSTRNRALKNIVIISYVSYWVVACLGRVMTSLRCRRRSSVRDTVKNTGDRVGPRWSSSHHAAAGVICVFLRVGPRITVPATRQNGRVLSRGCFSSKFHFDFSRNKIITSTSRIRSTSADSPRGSFPRPTQLCPCSRTRTPRPESRICARVCRTPGYVQAIDRLCFIATTFAPRSSYS